MTRLAAFALIIFLSGLSVPLSRAHAAGFTNVGIFTIQTSRVPSDQTNFPVEVTGTYEELKTTGNGGTVTSSNGYDVEFYANSDCSTGKLAWETEKWSGASGHFVYWVKIPTVSHSSHTSFYLCSGNASVTTDQSNPTGVWSGWGGVWHFPNGSTLTANDSTSHANNGTVSGANAIAGQIDGAAVGTSSGGISMGTGTSLDPGNGNTDLYISAWVKRASPTGTAELAIRGTPSADGYDFELGDSPCGPDEFKMTKFGVADLCAGAMPEDTDWHYVVGIWNSSGETVYVDAASSGSNADGTTFNSLGANTFETITDASSVDELRVNLTPQSPDWITTEYNNQSSPSTFYSVSGETPPRWTPLPSGINNDGCDFGIHVTSMGATAGDVSAGDVIFVDVNYDLGPPTGIVVSDNLGNTYTQVATEHDPVAGQNVDLWMSFVTRPGTPTATVQFEPSPGTTQGTCDSMIVDPFAGSDASSSADGSSGNFQISPGTGADTVSSGTYSTTRDGDLIYTTTGVPNDIDPSTATAGTGQTDLTAVSSADAVLIQSEYQVQGTHSGSTAGTWTASNGGDNYGTISIAITPAGSGGGGTSSLPKVSVFQGMLKILKGILFIN